MDKIGKRVMVIGSPGSGKSTFSKKLANISGLPLIHLDKEYWHYGWIETPNAQWVKKQHQLISSDEWIVDGNYGSTLEIRLKKADTIIYFKLNRLVCLTGYFKRVITNLNKVRPDMTEGCPERFDWEFVKYIWKFPATPARENVDNTLRNIADKKVIVFTSRKQANLYLKKLK